MEFSGIARIGGIEMKPINIFFPVEPWGGFRFLYHKSYIGERHNLGLFSYPEYVRDLEFATNNEVEVTSLPYGYSIKKAC